MTDRDPKRAKRSTLERLAEALYADCLERGAFEYHTAGEPTYNAVVAVLREYAHEVKVPPRAKVDVDADIADEVRRIPFPDARDHDVLSGITVQRLRALAREEHSGPTGAAAKESREDIAAPAGAPNDPGPPPALDDPLVAPGTPRCPHCGHPFQFTLRGPGSAPRDNPCSVPEADPERQSETCDGCDDASRPPLYRVKVPARTEWLCARCVHDRPCGCDDTEALGLEVDQLKNRLAAIRRLARSRGVQALFEEIDGEP